MPTWFQGDETKLDAPWFPDSWTLNYRADHQRRLDGMRLAKEQVDVFLEGEQAESIKRNAPAWKDAVLVEGCNYADSYSENMGMHTRNVFMDAFVYELTQRLKNE